MGSGYKLLLIRYVLARKAMFSFVMEMGLTVALNDCYCIFFVAGPQKMSLSESASFPKGQLSCQTFGPSTETRNTGRILISLIR